MRSIEHSNSWSMRCVLIWRCVHRADRRATRQRVVMLDADMIVRRNMDHLLEMELAKDWIAAAHVCACNPRRLSHYPEDWYVRYQVRPPAL